MERSEPSLVPEWLKGVGNGGNVHHTLHQDDGSFRPQRPSLLGINSDNESPRYAPPRRLGSSPGPFSPVYEKNGYSSGRVYPNFSSSSRTGAYRNSYDSAERSDWDLDKERDRVGGFLNDAKDDRPEARWGSSGLARFGQDFSARRFNAVGNSYRENGDRKNENGLGTGTSGCAQKAVFDRNFPSLSAQHAQHEKPYSSLAGNVAGLSPRHHWQHPSRPGDAGNTSSETWTSSLAEPIPNGQAHPTPASPLPSMNGPKMAEALAPRVRTPPQLSADTQKLEELALKQSRQLVPMIPKITTPNSKLKPKLAPMTTSKAVTSSQLAPGYRPQGVSRPETAKLHVLSKPDSGAGAPLVSAVPGVRAVAGPASNIGPRKQKQLLDRRALPIPPLPAVQEAVSSVSRPKENGITEDKRLTQNRSDFFNTLRKKAATAGNSSGGKQEQDGGSPSQKSDSTVAAVGSEDSKFEHQQNGGNGLVESAESGDDNVDNDKDKLPTSNGVSNGCYEQQHSRPDAVRVSEEEEAAFLRSLGWKEEDDVEGGLTEEEINAFFQQHMRSMTSSPLSSKRHMKLNAVLGMRVGGVSPGISSSDSESDGEVRNNARLQA